MNTVITKEQLDEKHCYVYLCIINQNLFLRKILMQLVNITIILMTEQCSKTVGKIRCGPRADVDKNE